MPLFDLPPQSLVTYESGVPAPADLADFWERTLRQARDLAAPVSAVRVDTGLTLVETYDVTFSGFGGDPVRAWYHRPAAAPSDLPVVVRYQGYGGGRGLAHQVPLWPLAGYACLNVDTRGQGSASSPGDTPDPAGSTPAHPGYLTRGILDPEAYYYRRVFTDALLAVDALTGLPGADPGRVAVAGSCRGGGIAVAVAALRTDLAGVLADVPFLSDFRRGSEVSAAEPYTELTAYLSVHRDQLEQVFATLAYFDISVLARSAQAPALFSVALMDQTCPPSTVYAAYNSYAGAKEIRVYPFNDHEGGQAFHEAAALRWLGDRFPGVAGAL